MTKSIDFILKALISLLQTPITPNKSINFGVKGIECTDCESVVCVAKSVDLNRYVSIFRDPILIARHRVGALELSDETRTGQDKDIVTTEENQNQSKGKLRDERVKR